MSCADSSRSLRRRRHRARRHPRPRRPHRAPRNTARPQLRRAAASPRASAASWPAPASSASTRTLIPGRRQAGWTSDRWAVSDARVPIYSCGPPVSETGDPPRSLVQHRPNDSTGALIHHAPPSYPADLFTEMANISPAVGKREGDARSHGHGEHSEQLSPQPENRREPYTPNLPNDPSTTSFKR